MKKFAAVFVLLLCCAGVFGLEITGDAEADVVAFHNETMEAVVRVNAGNYIDMDFDAENIIHLTAVNGILYAVTTNFGEYISGNIKETIISTVPGCSSDQDASVLPVCLPGGFDTFTNKGHSTRTDKTFAWSFGRSTHVLYITR